MNHDGTPNTMTDDDGDQQRWIDELLRSSAAAELEAAPAGAKFATAEAMGKLRRRQRRRRSLAVFTAAAAVAVVWAWPSSPLPRREGPGEALKVPIIAQSTVESPSVENPSPSPSLQGRGTFVASGDAIAVELESPAPEVTVVRLHPTTIAQRRAQSELILHQLLAADPNGG